MARQARIVIPHSAHHISQRGQAGRHIFFEKSDFQSYLDILEEQCAHFGVDILNYCLLPNQVHFIAIPHFEGSLARAIGETNRQYSSLMGREDKAVGSLFQNRFFSYAMDEQASIEAACFVENLPVFSRVSPAPENYLWSSARYRLKSKTHPFLKAMRSFHAMQNWSQYLLRPMSADDVTLIQRHLQTGRPRGNDMFINSVEAKIGRSVRPQKRGRKPKAKVA